jgi:D-alanyl-D-alanine carboxypeptidase/D-alanyl-D-alanine-endopeptidase (penicillin-binding protein 4)
MFRSAVFAYPAFIASIACVITTFSLTHAKESQRGLPYRDTLETSFRTPSANTIRQAIQELRQSTGVDGRLGVNFYSLNQNEYIYRSNDTDFYTPASTLKLLVTAATLHTFPKEYYPKTKIALYGTLDSSTQTFYGDIHIIGEGDPNVSARFAPSNVSLLDSMVQELQNMGIRRIHGSLVPIDTFFLGNSRPKYWKKRHFNYWYGAEVSALSYNDNCFYITISPTPAVGALATVSIDPHIGYMTVDNQVQVVAGKEKNIQYLLDSTQNKITLKGSIGVQSHAISKDLPIKEPSRYFAHALHARLKKAHIPITPSIASKSPSLWKDVPLFQTRSFQTVPTATIIQTVNQNSQNLHGEILLRLLGEYLEEQHRNASNRSSVQKGLLAEKQFIRNIGLNPRDFRLYDGSGLSHRNKVRGTALTQLLVAMAKSPRAKEYIQSLATPGVHGIKKVRLKHLGKKLKMKTGYIDPVQALCGYLFTSEKDTIAFSIFLNDYTVSKLEAETFVDSLISKVAHWYHREEPSLKYAKRLLSSNHPENYKDRLVHFSKALEGKPYKLGPTGEGVRGAIDSKPLLNLWEFDCVTYMESVMALSMSSHPNQVIPHLNKIRYFSDSTSYITRKHFFIEDWIYKSPKYVRTVRFPMDTTHTRITGKQFFFKLKQIPFLGEDPSTPLSYVPYQKALTLMDNWGHYKPYKSFLGVAFVTRKPEWLWVSHTGFLDATEGGKPQLRHASSKTKKVVSQDFKEYLLSRKGSILGVYFFEFNTPMHLKKGTLF